MNIKIKPLLCLALAVAVLSALLCSCGGRNDDATAVRIASEIKSVNRLVLSQMSVSKMAAVEDLDLDKAIGPKQSVLAIMDALKIGDRKAVFSYNTYMRAYIDLSGFSRENVKVNSADSVISISLPPIQTEFAGRDPQMRVEHYRVTGLRSQVGAEDRAEIKEQINAALKKEVENDRTFRKMLVESAQASGRRFFNDLCGRYGYKADVTFK